MNDEAGDLDDSFNWLFQLTLALALSGLVGSTTASPTRRSARRISRVRST